jgi:hypothetical protein
MRELDRALVLGVDVRDDALDVQRPGVLDQPFDECPTDALAARFGQDAWVDEREPAERREPTAAAADGAPIDASEDEHAVGCAMTRELLGRDRIVRLDSRLDRCPRLEPRLVVVDELDLDAHGSGPCIVRARDRVA